MSLSKFLTSLFFLILGCVLKQYSSASYIVISAKARQEFLSAIQEAMNMEIVIL